MTEKKVRRTRQSVNREVLESRILRSAEIVFASKGFSGASMERIAEISKISKQNLIYYFPNKDLLYKRVLKEILDIWIEKLSFIELNGNTPQDIIGNYVREKMRISRLHPNGSKVFAHEIISGAPVLKSYLVSHLKPQFDRDVDVVKSWINKGLIDDIDPEHLFFTIWAATQTYADFSVQMEVLLGKKSLEEDDYERAELAVTDFVMRALGAKKNI
ncbi:TetR/AcrR family transcriptional regulator [Marinomonas colpomeniae]|uniref:TetR family transcriptional regulator C-terminal domain-containing protein n=1 Tax=Marinomonas colpomeniae TaxID=2774408 RepID=A0ABR8P3H7_9GAMM|nr:TetR family transcriptional regulator C-terminal domain-containing protein [Marinomonas colpomeniae]MBD5772420.1 TetR family transcriptional regulator C-terminal domain-containing protein [Marinomonas colpomeniae]